MRPRNPGASRSRGWRCEYHIFFTVWTAGVAKCTISCALKLPSFLLKWLFFQVKIVQDLSVHFMKRRKKKKSKDFLDGRDSSSFFLPRFFCVSFFVCLNFLLFYLATKNGVSFFWSISNLKVKVSKFCFTLIMFSFTQ